MASLSVNNKVYPVHPNSFEETQITKADFGNNFIWGVGTSAYPIKGGMECLVNVNPYGTNPPLKEIIVTG